MGESPGPEKLPANLISSTRKRRKWLFRGVAIILGLSILPTIEISLRLLDIGPNTSLVIPVGPSFSGSRRKFTHQFNSAADLAFFGRTDLSGPESRPFVLPRPPRTYRVVVLGESTVIGFPYASELSFPRHIEKHLQNQIPDRDVEVLNAGITGINSFAIASLAAQCLEAQPDVIVVHAGHNEFYGPGGPGSTAFNFPPAIIRLAFVVRQWRTVQLVTGGYDESGPQDDLLNILPQELDIPLGGSIYQQAMVNFETNLRTIVSHCSDAGVPVLLTTVACNLRDQSPMLPSSQGNSNAKQVDAADLAREATEKMTAGDFDAALPLLQKAGEILPENANLHYRIGQCYHAQGRFDDAWKSFSLSRDLDGCRFRMPSEFYTVVEKVADSHDNCSFLDLTAEFKNQGAGTVPGNELFLEHVHYNFDGHYLVGKLIATAVQTQCRGLKWDTTKELSLADAGDQLGFLPEDDLAATSFAIRVLETGPFSKSIGREQQREFLINRATKLFTSLSELRKNVFADLPIEQMAENLPENLLRSHQVNGDKSFCDVLRICQAKRKPWK